MDWLLLEAEEQLQEINRNSYDASIKGIVLFKHSTRCSISLLAKSRLEKSWTTSPTTPIYYLDLLQYRSISNTIADDYGIEHQSPQILIIKNGKCIYTTSHSNISTSNILDALV